MSNHADADVTMAIVGGDEAMEIVPCTLGENGGIPLTIFSGESYVTTTSDDDLLELNETSPGDQAGLDSRLCSYFEEELAAQRETHQKESDQKSVAIGKLVATLETRDTTCRQLEERNGGLVSEILHYKAVVERREVNMNQEIEEQRNYLRDDNRELRAALRAYELKIVKLKERKLTLKTEHSMALEEERLKTKALKQKHLETEKKMRADCKKEIAKRVGEIHQQLETFASDFKASMSSQQDDSPSTFIDDDDDDIAGWV